MKFLTYLSRFVEDGQTGQPSVKRFGLALAVTILCGIILGIGIVICVIGLGVDPENIIRALDILADTLVSLAGLVLTAVTTGYVMDKALNRKREKLDESNKTTTDRSPDDS